MPAKVSSRFVIFATFAILLLGLVFAIPSFFSAYASTQSTTSEWQNLGLYGAQGQPLSGLVIAPDGDSLYLCNRGGYNVHKLPITQETWQPLTNSLWGCGSLTFDAQRDLLYVTASEYGWVLRSSDGGETWETPLFYIGPEDEFGPIHNPTLIAIDPGTPQKVLFTTRGREKGLKYTLDDGQTWSWAQFSQDGTSWETSLDGDPGNLSIDPTDNDYVFLSVGSGQPWSLDRGVYRSTDGGLTFQRLLLETYGMGIGVGVSPIGTVFAALEGGLYRSWDKGETWTFTDMGSEDYGSENISFHPVSTQTVWIQDARSDDEGETWVWLGRSALPPVVHPVQTNLYFRLTPYGVGKSVDAGLTWSDINHGLEEVGVHRVTTDPTNTDMIFVAADGGIGYTEDGGATWSYPILDGRFSDIVIDPADRETIYAVDSSCQIQKSLNRGVDWAMTDFYDEELNYCPNLSRLVLDPTDTQTGFLSAGDPNSDDNRGTVYKTVDGGTNWVSTSLPNHPPVEDLLWVSDTQKLYAGALNAWNDATLGGIYISGDKGESWTRSGLEGIDVYHLSVHPLEPLWIYASTRDGLYRSKNGGDDWEAVIPGENTYETAMDPNDPDRVFALVHSNILVSLNAGDSWQIYYEHDYDGGLRRPETIYIPWLSPETAMMAQTAGSYPSVIYMGTSQGLYAQEIHIEMKVFLPAIRR